MGITKTKLTKTAIAMNLGVSRSSLYYQPKKPCQDQETKNQIESVMVKNPAYGHRRVATDLKMNHKKIGRVMNLFGLKPARRRVKPPPKDPEEESCTRKNYPNFLKLLCPFAPNIVWVADFTYIKYQGRFIYLATVIDLFTRELLGVAISRFHDRNLVMEALIEAIKKRGTAPLYLHSDQGSEYLSHDYIYLTETHHIQISLSDKGSPWQNGSQESFFSQFKLDFGEFNRYDGLGELVEAIYQHVDYYNNRRIHSSLDMPPAKFYQRYINKQKTN